MATIQKSDYGLRLVERIYAMNKSNDDIATSVFNTPKQFIANEVCGMQHFLNLAVPFTPKLVTDGDFGSLTRAKLKEYLVQYQQYEKQYKEKNSNYNTNTLFDTAYSYRGQEEIRGNFGFKDSTFLMLMQAVGWRKTEAWCMYFVKVVVTEWLQDYGFTGINTKILNGSTQTSLRNLIAYNEKSNPGKVAFFHNPNYNSIMFYENRKKPATGHVGLPESNELLLNKNTQKITLRTIEGNTTNADSVEREGHIVAVNDRLIESGPTSSLILQGFFDFGYMLKLIQGGYGRV